MRRKMPGEAVERLRHADASTFDRLASMLARFADDYRNTVRAARPHLPDALDDRSQDNWEPLLAIAQCAGSDWLTRATRAALILSGKSESQSTGNELLHDIQHVFDKKRVLRIGMAELIVALLEDDEAAWSTYNRGKPLTPRQLGKMLSGYGIKSRTLRTGYDVAKGFEREQFEDAFARYLASPPEFSVTSVTQPANPISARDSVLLSVQLRNQEKTASVTPEPAPLLVCNRVTEKTSIFEGEAEL
ncbi:MAG: DUF3631 domain-containing protein, partial [Gammaproteobacteria bacterium]|nr:DUF3631 domain-containing protein [Gammaproteobacteria bacterium]